MAHESLIACHDCDLLHRVREIPRGGAARCSRCGSVLYRRPADTVDAALALTVTSLALFLMANLYPFMYFKVAGRIEVNYLITGVFTLNDYGMPPLAVLILLCSILAPGLKIALMLYVLVPVKLGRTAPGLARAFRWLETVSPWGMIEVYMMGVIVAIVNLLAIASIDFGMAFYCFVALFFVMSAASAKLDPHLVWERLE
jgi:paraquat-inducible protein A